MQILTNSITLFILPSLAVTITWTSFFLMVVGFLLITFFLRVISIKKYQKQIDDLYQQRMHELQTNEKIQEEMMLMESKIDQYKNKIGDLEEALQEVKEKLNAKKD